MRQAWNLKGNWTYQAACDGGLKITLPKIASATIVFHSSVHNPVLRCCRIGPLTLPSPTHFLVLGTTTLLLRSPLSARQKLRAAVEPAVVALLVFHARLLRHSALHSRVDLRRHAPEEADDYGVASVHDVTLPEVRSSAQAFRQLFIDTSAAAAPFVAGLIAVNTSLHQAILNASIVAWIVATGLVLLITYYVSEDIEDLRNKLKSRANNYTAKT